MFYGLIRGLAWIFARLIFRIRCEGQEQIPSDGKYIVVSNHRSNFDPVFLAGSIQSHLCFMAKQELFKIPVFGFALKKLHAFPIERGKDGGKAIETAIREIEKGRPLLIFPEGTRSKDGKLLRPRSGAAVIAHQTSADILPVGIVFDRLRFRSRVTIRFGAVISNKELGIENGQPREIKEASRLIMDRIESLVTV